MATVTPNFTEISLANDITVLARGSTSRGTVDLRTNFGGYASIKIGRGGTAVLSAGVDILIRRVLNNDVAVQGGVHPAGSPSFLSSTVAASSTTVNVDSASGQAALNVASISGFAAGDIICINDAGLLRTEWHRVSKTAAGVLTLDRPLQVTHTSAQADTVRNKADAFAPVWLSGGSLWEVIFDYGSQTTGDSITVACWVQRYDSETVI